jgi:hypothetical protein
VFIHRAMQRASARWSICDVEVDWSELVFCENGRKSRFWYAQFLSPFFSTFLVWIQINLLDMENTTLSTDLVSI